MLSLILQDLSHYLFMEFLKDGKEVYKNVHKITELLSASSPDQEFFLIKRLQVMHLMDFQCSLPKIILLKSNLKLYPPH